MDLKNKVALVTGSAQGIGLEIARKMACLGADLVLADLNPDQVEESARRLAGETGREVFSLKMNVAAYPEVEQGVKKIIDKYTRLDILVNNAGITRDGLIMRMSEEEWDLVISVNLKGTFNGIKAVSRPMIKQRGGRIINIASVIGLMGNAGQANYAASKAGVIGLTRTAARELASRNITVNAIAPGFIKTAMTGKLSDEIIGNLKKMIPLGRLGEPEDIAKTAAWLASEEADYITGQVITVDGGMVMY